MAKTKVQEKVVEKTTNSNERPNLPLTLRALQFLRTAKGAPEAEIHKHLDGAFTELKKVDMVLLLERIMLHIGDVSRQHNILSELGIKSDKGGAQERRVFRCILRWWEKNLPKSFAINIRPIVEFTVLENVMFYQNTTDRKTGKLLNTEVLFPNREVVFDFLTEQIRKGKNLNLIARHLPKYETGKFRTAKKVIRPRKGIDKFNWTLPKDKAWVKLNGELVKGEKIEVKLGDVVSYPRGKQSDTLKRQEFINTWIKEFCENIGWTIAQYKEFRSKQDTAEQKFSSKSILTMPKSDFVKFLDSLTAGQRFRVACTICNKQGENLVPVEKWKKLGEYYIEWEANQSKVAEQLRVAYSEKDETKRKELQKDLKVKATGVQTIDLLAKMLKGGLSDEQINNTYQAMIEKMDLIANVFVVLDGSGSMDSTMGHGYYSQFPIAKEYSALTKFDVAAAMAITFSTRNPVDQFRNTFAWFSSDFKIVGKSKYVNEAPNKFVDSAPYTKKINEQNILSELATFTENFKSMKKCNPGIVAGTNMFKSIEYFVDLVKANKSYVEDLPVALLYITDNENNQGKSPAEAQALAQSIGWNPLLIFWGIEKLPDYMEKQIKDVPNILLVGGFSESVLSQILRGIKTGSVNPQDELWSIFEDKRYSVIK